MNHLEKTSLWHRQCGRCAQCDKQMLTVEECVGKNKPALPDARRVRDFVERTGTSYQWWAFIMVCTACADRMKEPEVPLEDIIGSEDTGPIRWS